MGDAEDQRLLEEVRLRLAGGAQALGELEATRRTLALVNERLVAAESLRTHFIANVRNEINNPLTAILGLSREIAALAGGGELAALAEALLDEAAALDLQIRNILVAGDIESGECAVQLARVDVRRVLEEIVLACSRLGAARNVRIASRWQGSAKDPSEFRTDAAKLELLVLNLLSNAVRFSPDDAEIVVAAYRGGEWLLIRVEDTGAGLLPEHRGLAFEHLRQLSAGTAKGWPGQGLGLAVVRALLEELGGSVEVDDRPGQGSVFTVRLPEGGAEQEDVPYAPEGNALVFGEERF